MTFYSTLLDNSVALYSSSSSSNSMGHVTKSWVYYTSGVNCRLVPNSAEYKKDLPGEYQDINYIGYFEPSTSLSNDYRIKYDNDYYEIKEIYIDTEGITQKAYLKKVDD